MSAAYQERLADRLARVHAELERLRVSVEPLPSGAVRLRKGGSCHLMVAGLEFVSEDDLVMFAGGPERAYRHVGIQG